jgi:hypothetical protein
MAKKEITVQLNTGEFYDLREQAAKHRSEDDEYAKQLILDGLNGNGQRENTRQPLAETFGEFVVEELGVSGDKRGENVAGVSQTIYDQWEREEGEEKVPWELWNESVKAYLEVLDEQDGRDPEKYRTTVVGNCTSDIGIDGNEAFRFELAHLAERYERLRSEQ